MNKEGDRVTSVVEEKDAIRELSARYCFLVDEARFDEKHKGSGTAADIIAYYVTDTDNFGSIRSAMPRSASAEWSVRVIPNAAPISDLLGANRNAAY